MAGKRARRPLKVSAAGNSGKNTLSVWDRRTGRSYLVDTGADVSVYPANAQDKATRAMTNSLIAANGSAIPTWGQRSLLLAFGGQRLFSQDFYLADVTQPILGADFFTKNHLAIDLRGRRLIDLDDCSSLAAKAVAATSVTIAGLSTQPSNALTRLVHEFPEILVPRFDSAVNKHGIEHHIVTTGPPVHARAHSFGVGKAKRCQTGISTNGEDGHCPQIQISLVLADPLGTQEQRLMAPMWGLSPVKCRNRRRPLPATSHTGLQHLPLRSPNVFEN